MFPGVVVTDLDGTHTCNVGSVYINLTCFEYRSTEDPHILSSASDWVIPIAMVSVVTPDKPQESTPLCFEDLSQSELVNLVKVRNVSTDSARLSTLTTPQDTGCIEGFPEVEKCIENAIKTTNSINQNLSLEKCNES